MQDIIDSLDPDARSADTVFALLCDERRRIAVAYLAEESRAVPLADVAAAVAARDTEAEPDEVPSDARDRAAAALHHNHLPRLSDCGVVDYDPELNVVTPTAADELAGVTEPIASDCA